MYKDNINNDYEYNTPLYLFNYLNKHFKFELDPCDDGESWLGLPNNFTKKDNGLKQEWIFNAFVNPPYGSKNEDEWLKKCIRESYRNDTVNFILLPSKTEAKWFSYAMTRASVIIFPQGRISFIKKGKPMNGNIVGSVIFGFIPKPDRGRGLERDHFFSAHDNMVEEDVSIIRTDNYDIYFPDKEILKQKYSFIYI
jgi:phage N-6-adenine-methyltransferase